MASTPTIEQVKDRLRIRHNVLDNEIAAEIDACLADLRSVGVAKADETDPLILNAIKLWALAHYSDDKGTAAEYSQRYDKLKGTLMVAEGYAYGVEGGGSSAG